jgi:excisionase family DNA binding protein
MRPRGPFARLRIVASVEPNGLQPNRPELYSVRQVADQLGVHPETIRRLIHDGRLDAVRVGRVLRVHAAAVDGFLARQRVKPSTLDD